MFVMGTNGKTTTTKIITELLEAEGKRVLTNATGSNLTRGIISGILQHATWGGNLRADLAVFEVDEAYAKRLINQVQLKWVLALNVSRDQLDRFGEVDAVAKMLANTMDAAKKGVVTNADDPYLSAIGTRLAAKGRNVTFFGADRSLQRHFPSENLIASVEHGLAITNTNPNRPQPQIELSNFYKQNVTYVIRDKPYRTHSNLVDPHNYLNAAAALALVTQLLPNTPIAVHLKNMIKITPAYGRGEIFKLGNGSAVQLTLVKNPASFFQALASHQAAGCDIMIAINDNYADSRDVSWLWDVDFSRLKEEAHIISSGRRAADMALRLHYDGIAARSVPDMEEALELLLRSSKRKVIFATYTAMLRLYNLLKKRAAKVSP